MATPKGGTETDMAPRAKALSDRIAGAARGMWSGWFGPDQPLTPIAPREEVVGRKYDFPYGVNLAYAPRTEQGEQAVPFAVLRAIADPARGGLDLLRIAIETRKSQMASIKWNIQSRDGKDDGGPKARKIEQFLRRPDGYNTFRQWQRSLLEDHFVIDAVTLYPRKHPDYTRLEPMDGATIKLVIDEFGRVPMPPFERYQQFLKGVPAVDYTVEELRYYASNQRTDHIYGYSRVEQVIGMVSIALNRQVSIGSYYTQGSIPEVFIEMPATLSSSAQIKEYDEYWQALLSGQVPERWKAKMVPAGAKIIFAKDALLKNEFDEWLARIICYAFDLQPTALVKETNRSVSDNQKETAIEEGLLNTKGDFKDWIDDMIERDFGAAELEFAYDEEEVIDPKTNAEIVVSLYGGTTGTSKPVITLDEAREKLGLDPATDAQREELQPPEPEPVAPELDENGNPKPPAAAVDKNGNAITPSPSQPKGKKKPDEAAKARRRAGRVLPAPKLSAHTRAELERKLADAIAPYLSAMGHTLAGVIREKTSTVTKAARDIDRLLAALTPGEWDHIETVVGPLLVDYAREYARQSSMDVAAVRGIEHGALDAILSQSNEKAAAWAMDRAAEMVTEIDDTTRDGLRRLMADAIDEGQTNEQIAADIATSDLFGGPRAMLIARTETTNAENNGTVIGWRESGVVRGKGWVPDAEACEICLDNEADGEIGLDEAFSSGDTEPGAHPNCECTLEAYLDDPGDTGEGDSTDDSADTGDDT